LGYSANPIFGQKRGDLAAFEKALAEIAAESPRKTDHISFYVSIGHFYCQLKQSRGGGSLNVDDALEILYQGDPRTQQNPQDVIFQGKAMEVANELLCP
jgi:hypothetical protein